MKVYLTVDTECTEERQVRGGVRPPQGYQVAMFGSLGAGPSYGLPLLIHELSRFNHRATFFLEPLCSLRFGEEGLGQVVEFIQSANHEVQLHLHPNFLRPEWRLKGCPAPEDNIGRLPPAEQSRLIGEGLAILGRCGVRRDDLLAFRAGNYGASNSTLEALASHGVVLDASLNPAYLHSDCGIRLMGSANDLFSTPMGVWELPVTCFREPLGGLRHLQLTAVSSAEMRYVLSQLHRAGVRHCSIVTHPSEFFVVEGTSAVSIRPNAMNIWRLRSLCRWLSEYSHRFHVTTVGVLARELLDTPTLSTGGVGGFPRGSGVRWALRLSEQAVKRIDMRTGLLKHFANAAHD